MEHLFGQLEDLYRRLRAAGLQSVSSYVTEPKKEETTCQRGQKWAFPFQWAFPLEVGLAMGVLTPKGQFTSHPCISPRPRACRENFGSDLNFQLGQASNRPPYR